MMNENLQCEMRGFGSESEIKSIASMVADKLYFSAPSDSAVQLAIQKSRGVVRASCRIASQVGTFFAEATGKNYMSALQRLERRVEQQLNSWKMNRFGRAF